MKGFTVWFTGLSGAGKTTLATAVAGNLRERGLPVEVLDGDDVRRTFWPELGFTREDRDRNVTRLGALCALLNRHGVAVLVAAIAPYRAAREENRRRLGRYVEVYCRCDLATLERRDPKELYAKARRGEIPRFTGVSDPYEEPTSPEVLVDTAREEVEGAAARVVARLEALGYVPPPNAAGGTTPAEEEEMTRRLEDLGYL